MEEMSKDGTVKITNGKIIIENPKGMGKPPQIFASHNVRLIVDGVAASGKCAVFEDSNIEVIFDETEASREMRINTAEDGMTAWITICYKPKTVYKLKDAAESTLVELAEETADKVYPPKFKIQEISAELSNNKIIYGIIDSNLKKCAEEECSNLLIAEGEKVTEGINDKVELSFSSDKKEKFKVDETGNIDFKSIGAVQDVKKGETIAVKIPGQEGREGHDIYGRVSKPKNIKKLSIKAGKGCIIKGDTVVSLIDGKPCVRNNVFSVFEVHEVKGDVDISTGNVTFIGDINILGGVAEGMQIISGNTVKVNRDVEGSVINAKGDINIGGNVIRAKLYGGGEDVSRLKVLTELDGIRTIVKNIVDAVAQIKEHNILGDVKKDGDIIKLLIETKYKNLTVACIKAVASLGGLYEEEKQGKVSELIRQKLLGLAPLNIRNYGELDQIIEGIDILLMKIKSELSVPVTVSFSYCQDSIVKSSGDILITGKGVYISEITANGRIKFLNEKSVARGGVITAARELSCRIVGSPAGVPTRLQVDKDGEIFVDAAYQNTVFAVGQKEYALEKPSKNVHVYLNLRGDIIVDKLLLEV